jgi:hypothetical protein
VTRPGGRAVLSLLLLAWVTPPLGLDDTTAPMHCSSYTVGADTHTECSPGPSSPPGAEIRCASYTVGTDTHAECAPVPATRLGTLRGRLPTPPPASGPRCYTYRIGSSAYTECR